MYAWADSGLIQRRAFYSLVCTFIILFITEFLIYFGRMKSLINSCSVLSSENENINYH